MYDVFIDSLSKYFFESKLLTHSETDACCFVFVHSGNTPPPPPSLLLLRSGTIERHSTVGVSRPKLIFLILLLVFHYVIDLAELLFLPPCSDCFSPPPFFLCPRSARISFS